MGTILVSLASVSERKLEELSYRSWIEELLQEEMTGGVEELLEGEFEMLALLVGNLPALDRAVVERAYGFNGIEAVEDVSQICHEQDLTLEEVLVILERSLQAIGERLLALHRWSAERREQVVLAQFKISVE